MSIIQISQAKDYVNQTVTIQGWMYNKRGSGKIYFLQLRDGSGFMQGIASAGDLSDEVMSKAIELTAESSVKITGKIVQHPKKQEVFEMQVSDIEIICLNEGEYPISKKEHGPDFLLDNRHLWLRSKKQWAIQRIRNTVINATYEYLNDDGFIKIDSPILTPNSCEDSTELFEIEYFDHRKAYLTQTGQLYLEAAIMSHGRVFDFGPVFRAEKSKTRRHLTEFWMMDAEAAFVDYKENIDIQERLVCHIVQKVLNKNMNELLILERDIEALKKIKAPFIRKTHAEVVVELQEMGSDIQPEDDLGADDETTLTKKYDKPIFIEKYPAAVKAFYMKRDPEDNTRALCSDLLAPEGYGEIIGGSEREENYNILLERLKEHDLNPKDYEWYLDLRKYGSVPHSGFGYGLERIVGWMCGINHIREAIPFPRLMNRIKP